MSRCAITFPFFNLYICNISLNGESFIPYLFANYKSDDKIYKN